MDLAETQSTERQLVSIAPASWGVTNTSGSSAQVTYNLDSSSAVIDNEVDMLAWALYHARNNWAVFPLAPSSKKPLSRTNGYLEATTDEAQILAWWKEHPTANIGGVPGLSDRLVLDVDPRHGGDVTLQRLTEDYGPAFLQTTTTLTGGGGEHLTYAAEGLSLPSQKRALGAGIEAIASTGYILLPPSLHPNGTCYIYEEGYSPREIDYRPLPAWVIERLQKQSRQRDIVLPSVNTSDIGEILLKEGGLRGEHLAATAGDPEFVVDACRLMGIPLRRLNAAFCCVLPGHQERHPSASIFKNKAGYYTYHDFHDKGDFDFLTLAEVAYALAAGEVRTLPAPALAAWHLRLLVLTGHAEPADVHLPPLPLDAPPWLRPVYRGFEFLLQCKWLYQYGEPTAFGRDFAATWCNVTPKQARTAIDKMVELGIIVPRGKHKFCKLFLPPGYI